MLRSGSTGSLGYPISDSSFVAHTNATTYFYDADNRKTIVQDANLNTTGYAYD